MPKMDTFRQGGTPFDGFLYAELGQDRDGKSVSVLSALARLGVDPWDEAADLADMPQDGARVRLGDLLARFRDVPALGGGNATVILRLVSLLPKAPARTSGQQTDLPAIAKAVGFGPIIAILLVVLVLVQTFFLGANGSGN
ncbi:MAG: hypothetical protein IKG52_16100 [Rhodobacteraceae bacterium]|nr:hypothetical protein [Paracoccaceae bacterium]